MHAEGNARRVAGIRKNLCQTVLVCPKFFVQRGLELKQHLDKTTAAIFTLVKFFIFFRNYYLSRYWLFPYICPVTFGTHKYL